MKNRIHHPGKILAAGTLAATLLTLLEPSPALADGVPVRISVKFVLNASNNRPAAGDLNTDAEVSAQFDRANQMLMRMFSELRFENTEITDVAGVSQWYSAEPTAANRNALRSIAALNPAAYKWRNNAVNVYITGAPGVSAGGIADFPPNNNIILLPQYTWDNVLAHEVGHILNLMHTHETCCGGDGCGDTLMDSPGWTRDNIAANNFGLVYNQLNSSQQWQVDQVWWNVMSYHNGDEAFRLTGCQMDRTSSQSYSDRSWVLSRTPVYVNAGYGGPAAGSFTQPFQTVQQAVNANAVAGRVMVLQQGVHARPSTLNVYTDMISRSGASTLQCQPVPFAMPSLEESANPALRQAVLRAQESARKGDLTAVVANLEEAEKHATGLEKAAVQLELGQRLRDSQDDEKAASYFAKAAESAPNENLRAHTAKRLEGFRKKAGLDAGGKETPPKQAGKK